MTRKLKKIKFYLNKYLDVPKDKLLSDLKISNEEENYIIFHHHKRCRLFFNDEIIFFVKDNLINDICITEYLFGIPITHIFHHRDQNFTYTIIRLIDLKICKY